MHVSKTSLILLGCLFSIQLQNTSAAALGPVQGFQVSQIPSRVRSASSVAIRPQRTDVQAELTINLALQNQSELKQLLVDLYDQNSPRFHQYLSAAEFTHRFQPSPQDYRAMIDWARKSGLTILRTTENRHLISAVASVAVINSTFNIHETVYRDSATGEEFFAPDREPTIVGAPLEIAYVEGLDSSDPAHPSLLRSNGTAATSTGAISLRKAYYGSGPLTGAGQTVAIISFDGYLRADLDASYASNGLIPEFPVINIPVNGFNGACTGYSGSGPCRDAEQVMDIVAVAAMAPGLTQILFYEIANSSQNVSPLLNQIAMDNAAKIISSSWAGGGFGGVDGIFQQYAAQGQSYLNASGDCGQYSTAIGTCNGTANSSTYSPPGLDPYVTVVGGTDLYTNLDGSWGSEDGWPGSGGGYLAGTYAIPQWQTLPNVINAQNVGSTTLRNSPDVSAESMPGICIVDNGFYECWGGTSLAAPLVSGYVALASEQAQSNGSGPIGFLNPLLYSIGTSSYASAFHDITTGSNPPTIGSGAGFNAVKGYDLVTGWGTPTPSLVDSLTLSSPPPVVFQAQINVGVGTAPYALVAADVNHDDQIDVAVTNYTDNTVSLLLNNNGGLLTPTANTTTFNIGSALGIAAADFDSDGNLDLAVANYGSAAVTILLGDGSGVFAQALGGSLATQVNPYGIAAADFNNDKIVDLAVANESSNSVSVFLGKGTGGRGDGTFEQAKVIPAGVHPLWITTGDFDKDGKADLAVTNNGSNSVSVFHGNGNGTFAAKPILTAGSGPSGIVAGDLNKDGNLDLVVANTNSNSVSVFYGHGDGTFASKVDYAAGSLPWGVYVADMNGDGFPDIVVSNSGSNTVGILLGNRYRTFQPQATYPTVSKPFQLLVTDVNGDNRPDIVVAGNAAKKIQVLLNGEAYNDTIFSNGF